MRKIFSITTLVVLTAIFTSSCNGGYTNNQQEVQQALIPVEKYHYANMMQFEFRVVDEDGEVRNDLRHIVLWLIHPGFNHFNPFYDQLVFVHNEEEALAFPDNVITAWPRDEQWLQGFSASLLWAINNPTMLEKYLRNEDGTFVPYVSVNGISTPIEEFLDEDGNFIENHPLTFEEFGLTYPLTTADFIYNWESINSLFHAFGPSERIDITNSASWRHLEVDVDD
jgi:hypothetical protein